MLRNKFLKNFLITLKGTSVAQLTPILISPLLTRMYSPSEFGIYAVYLAALSILTPVVNGRYELAIVLPKSKTRAYTLFFLSLIINILVIFILTITVMISSDIFGLLSVEGSQNNWGYLLPISLFLIGIMNPLLYLNNREQQFNIISNSRIKQSLGSGISQIMFGIIKIGNVGMVLGNIIGILLVTLGLGKSSIVRSNLKNTKINKKILKEVAIEHNQFPKYAMFTHTLENGTSNAPQLLLKKLYDATTTGYYSLSLRTVSLPISMVGNAIGNVFLSMAGKEYREKGNCKSTYNKTLLLVVLMPIIPFVTLYFSAEFLFELVFGSEWTVAGEYTKILIPALYFNFIANPLSHMFIIAEKVKLELVFQVLMLILTGAAFFIGSHFSVSAITMIKIYSVVLFTKNMLSIILSYKFSRVFKEKIMN